MSNIHSIMRKCNKSSNTQAKPEDPYMSTYHWGNTFHINGGRFRGRLLNENRYPENACGGRMMQIPLVIECVKSSDKPTFQRGLFYCLKMKEMAGTSQASGPVKWNTFLVFCDDLTAFRGNPVQSTFRSPHSVSSAGFLLASSGASITDICSQPSLSPRTQPASAEWQLAVGKTAVKHLEAVDHKNNWHSCVMGATGSWNVGVLLSELLQNQHLDYFGGIQNIFVLFCSRFFQLLWALHDCQWLGNTANDPGQWFIVSFIVHTGVNALIWHTQVWYTYHFIIF